MNGLGRDDSLKLSVADAHILDMIFNSKILEKGTETMPETEAEIPMNLPSHWAVCKDLEIRAINLAESAVDSADPQEQQSLYNEALRLLDEAIELAPDNPSPLNNKVQVMRLMGKHDSEEVMNMINRAIELASQQPFSKTILLKATSQRAWLSYRRGDNTLAFQDFESAGKLGCQESKKMAVRCNPYAALCNEMMQEVLGRTMYSRPQ